MIRIVGKAARGIVLLSVAAAASAAGPSVAQADEAQDFYWKAALASGKSIEIRGINGPIKAEPASGREAEVRAVKRGKKCDPSEVRIETIEHADGATICAVYPSGRSGRENTCEPDGRGHEDTEDCDVWVGFTVRVPAGVSLVARTVNGEIEARGLTAAVDAATVNGSIALATKGCAEATTVNGEIEVAMASKGWPSGLDFRTVNGGITIEMPGKVNADVSAETLNGSIESDFPLVLLGRMQKNRIRGTLGDGGPNLKLSTVNGSILLRRSPS